MPLQASGLADLIANTLKDLGEMKLTDIATDLQDYVAMNQLLSENNVKIDSGTSIQWNVMTSYDAGRFSFVGLYATDNVNVSDHIIQAEVPWRHATNNYAIDERELAMNRSPRKIVDQLKVNRHDAAVAQAEGMENAFWGYPATTDLLTPYGVAYWIVKSATAATKANNDGFNGGAQTGYTTVANINPSTYTRWKNYAAPYTAVSKADFCRATRRAMTHCLFKPAAKSGIGSFNTGDKWGLYTNYEVVSQLEELLEQQNDNLGSDLASQDGDVLFRRSPVKWVPKLDADTTNPMYGINWGVFKTTVLRGFWMKELKIENAPGQHTVCQVHMDTTLQWVCRDRRRNFVVSNGTTTPSA